MAPDHRDQTLVEFRAAGPRGLADIRDRVFDPFFTTDPVGPGTGPPSGGTGYLLFNRAIQTPTLEGSLP